MKSLVTNVNILSRAAYFPSCFKSSLGNCGFVHRIFSTASKTQRFQGLQKKETSSVIQNRHIFSTVANVLGGGPGKKLKYEEKHLIGYSMEQMYSIVSRTEKYSEFVPWCKESTNRRTNDPCSYDCQLTVGFYPLVEKYTSKVTVEEPTKVKSECSDGMLFNHLLTIWTFEPGLDEARKDTCVLTFFVEFEFRHNLHSTLAQTFFDEVIKKMVGAFFNRAEKLYGPQSMQPKRLKVVTHESH